MTRAAILALAALASLAWLLRPRPAPQPDPLDAVQPPDPVTTRPVVVTLPSSMTVEEVGHIRSWLAAHPDVIEELYESAPVASRLGPAA